MDAREIELLEIDVVWQVRAPKKRGKPRKRSRKLIWGISIALSPILVTTLMVFAIVYFGDAFIADPQTAGIAALLSCWATMFVLSALEAVTER